MKNCRPILSHTIYCNITYSLTLKQNQRTQSVPTCPELVIYKKCGILSKPLPKNQAVITDYPFNGRFTSLVCIKKLMFKPKCTSHYIPI